MYNVMFQTKKGNKSIKSIFYNKYNKVTWQLSNEVQ